MSRHSGDVDAEDGHASVEDAVYTLKVGSVAYAISLFWNDVDDPSKAAEEARKIAARPTQQSDLFCLRGRSEQYGLGRKADGHQKNMPALAGHLADSRSGTWCGVFRFPNGYYHVAVQDDAVVEDAFYVDEIDSQSRFADRVSVTDWSDVFAPESFRVENSKDVEIQSILTGKPPRLKETDRVGSMFKWGGFAAAIVVLVVGVAWYMKTVDEAEQARQMAELQARAAAIMPGQKQEVKPPPSPWEGRFKAVQYLAACKEAMSRAILSIPGWTPKGLVCDGNAQVTMVISRQAALGEGGGTINWVRWALDKGGMDKATASPMGDGNSVEVSWNFASTPDKWRPADVDPLPSGPNLSEIRKYLQSQLEEDFVLPNFQNPTQSQWYGSVQFSFKTQFDPTTFADILGRVKGLVVSNVSLDLQTNSYDIKGQANEQLPLPKPPGAPGAQPAVVQNGVPNAVAQR